MLFKIHMQYCDKKMFTGTKVNGTVHPAYQHFLYY